MYYALIMLSVVMFGGCFMLNDVYRKMRGSGIMASVELSFAGALAGLVFLLIINGFRIEFTPFAAIMGGVCAVNMILFTFLSLKALDYINLSLFSVFSMLGGMVLPFAQGIIFYGEKITLGKILCVIFITLALCFTITRGEKKKGYIFYIGVFVLNGMSGVISKLFNELPYEKTSAVGYSIWISIFTLLISGVIWLCLLPRANRDGGKRSIASAAVGAVSGGVNQIANVLLVMALMHVDSSVQYPMVTGGVMIVSTLACYFGDRKPSRRELLSVLLAFCGMLTLFLIPV